MYKVYNVTTKGLVPGMQFVYGFRVQSDQDGVKLKLHSFRSEQDGNWKDVWSEFSPTAHNTVERDSINIPAHLFVQVMEQIKVDLTVVY